MLIATIVLVFGIYSFFFLRRRWRDLPSEEEREVGGRIGRSVQGAFSVPFPGLAGQPGAHLMPGRLPDEIGPEDGHIVVLKEEGDDAAADGMSTEQIRARLDAIAAAPPRRSKRRG